MNPLARILGQTRISQIMDEVTDARATNPNLLWSRRIQSVDAVEGEIMARYEGRASIADIILDDGGARVKSSNPLTLETTDVPNIKHGRRFGQTHLAALQRLNVGLNQNDVNQIDTFMAQSLRDLIAGVEHRREALLWGMATDAVSYDKLGIKFDASFGMPSTLKVTPGVQWSTAASATPINDILALVQEGRTKYGIIYDRVTMSTTAFNAMVATTQYINQAKSVPFAVGFGGEVPVSNNVPAHVAIAGRILGMTVEIYDGMYTVEGANGSTSTARFLTEDTVVLSSSALDNNTMAADFANGIVSESLVAGLAGSNIGGFTGPQRGPVGYVTYPTDLNPPDVTLWAVQRGFPRRHMKGFTAILQDVLA